MAEHNPRRTQTAGAQSPTNTGSTQDVEIIIDAVQDCLDVAEPLTSILSGLHEAKVNGEPVQRPLEEVFQDFQAFALVASYKNNDELADALDQAVASGAMDQELREEFESFMAEVEWCTQAIGPLGGDRPWSELGLEAKGVEDGNLIIRHRMNRGFETIHDIDVGVDYFLMDAAGRANAATDQLEEHGDEFLDQEQRMAMMKIAESLAETGERLQQIAQGNQTDGTESEQSDGETSVQEVLGEIGDDASSGAGGGSDDGNSSDAQSEPRMFQ